MSNTKTSKAKSTKDNQTIVSKACNLDSMREDLKRHFEVTLGRDELNESHYYLYNALALTLRDRQIQCWRETRERYRDEDPKRVSYLSLEFLMGRALNNAILNLDLDKETRESLKEYAVDLEVLAEEESRKKECEERIKIAQFTYNNKLKVEHLLAQSTGVRVRAMTPERTMATAMVMENCR